MRVGTPLRTSKEDWELKRGLSSRLMALVVARGGTYREVATEMEISYSTFVNILAGRNLPSLFLLVRMARFFDVTTDHLLLGPAE